nr:zinc transporter ZupT [Schnuerera sp. xch1]
MINLDTSNVLLAFGLTLFAGLSTGIGSALAFYTKQTNKKFLSAALGFSAGVMIYVSFVEIFAEAKASLAVTYGQTQGYWITTIAFFGGMAIIALIDKFVPSAENPHEMYDVKEMKEKDSENATLMRMGLFSALAIAIHNFPEGIATFISAMEDSRLGLSIALAVAIHNIPEGIAVSVPIFYATGNRKKAFKYSFISGLAEPLGALLAYLVLMKFMNDMIFGVVFASVAGIMVYISLDELLPTAEKYGEHHIAIYGLIGGMIIMALSILLLV